VPFGLGCAIAVGLYNEFKDEPGTVQIDFAIFMLFIGVAMAITVSLVGFERLVLVLIGYLGFSGALPYLDGTEAAHDAGWCYCSFSGGWE